MFRARSAFLLLAFVQLPPFGGAGAFKADLEARRAKTMATLGPETVLVMWSAPERVYANDVNYEYHQDPNLYYLTGIQQEETALVLVAGAKTRQAWLFVRAADPRRELWNGHVLTPAEASAMSGIADVRTLDQL